MAVAVFHKIGTEGEYTNTIEQILAYDGQITFDGVYTSVFDYRHRLAKRKPILFVSGNEIGRDGFCSNIQLTHLKELGFELGWHGWSHRRLTELSDKEVRAELRTWPDIKYYAYPHGDWDARVAKIVKDMGYQKAYSTTQGEEGNDFAIPRVYLP